MKVILDGETVFALVVNPTEGERLVDVHHAVGPDRDMAINSIITYLSNGVKDNDPLIGQLLEVLISALEWVKIEHPELAAKVRKMNIEYLKNKQDENEKKI